jgi:UDP-glucose 4-epimerase
MTETSLAGRTCLLLGAGGFIGQVLAQRLVADGALVRCYGRRPRFSNPDPRLIWSGTEFADDLALARAVEGCDVVYHLIGGSLPESANKDPAGELLASAHRTIHLLDLCYTSGVGKIVFASSGGTVYGVPKAVPIAEVDEGFPISAYGITKLTIEKYIYLYEYLHNLNYMILRISNPYGPYQDPTKRQGIVAAVIARILSGYPIEIWGDGMVTRDFIYIEDVVSAFIAAACYDGNERIINIGSGIGRSINDVVTSVAAVTGAKDLKRIYRPGRSSDVPINVLDITRAEHTLGWTPEADWSQSLRATVDWLKAHQAIYLPS